MTFLHPEFLYLMLPPLLVLFWFLLTQKEPNSTFFSEEVLEKLKVNGGFLSLKARNMLFFAISVSMVIALAAPVIPQGDVIVKSKSADIMLALDISDSMLAQDRYPNRLASAKQKGVEFLRLADEDRVGVLAFARHSYLLSPLSRDHNAVAFLLEKLSVESMSEKGTDIMSLLEVMAKQGDKESKKYLLILSDGGDAKEFSKEIAFAKEQGIVIFGLGVGSHKGAPIKLDSGEFIKQDGKIVITKLNPAFASLSTQTGGVFVESVNSKADIEALYKEMALDKKEHHTKNIEHYIPLFYFPLGLALILLLLATSSMSKRQNISLPSAFLLASFLSFGGDLHAGLLDFVDLKSAKTAYDQGNYEESAKLYERYAQESNNPAAYYNAANALYKANKYKEAQESYKKAAFVEKNLEAKRKANLGNSYAKEKTPQSLQSAIKSYEESLGLQEDEKVRQNLEAVKEALKKMQEQQKNQEQQENQEKQQKNQEQQQKNQEENQQQQEQNQEQNQKEQESQKQEGERKDQQGQENQQEQENKQEQKNQTQEQNQQEKQAQKEKTQQQEQAQNSQMQQEAAESNKQNEQPQDLSAQQGKPSEISSGELRKWQEILEEDAKTYLYRLESDQTQKKERDDAKPW